MENSIDEMVEITKTLINKLEMELIKILFLQPWEIPRNGKKQRVF